MLWEIGIRNNRRAELTVAAVAALAVTWYSEATV
jgi:hypothetical protein